MAKEKKEREREREIGEYVMVRLSPNFISE